MAEDGADWVDVGWAGVEVADVEGGLPVAIGGALVVGVALSAGVGLPKGGDAMIWQEAQSTAIAPPKPHRIRLIVAAHILDSECGLTGISKLAMVTGSQKGLYPGYFPSTNLSPAKNEIFLGILNSAPSWFQ
ncbi:hypothetical protein [Alkalinema sp. FACHB-956]|uniref:hypothetical protein n=1 Tax=Alkalinema sp. FACHB-956 TaxID=2692768 RepID=UPI001688DA02|nr:hypothetical protein [Alkalinema sp. FACHB-956]MBD2329891.1 hypothetical protein [Alkalinema sp. FACHB-956]